VPKETTDRGAGGNADAVERLHEELGMGLDLAPIAATGFGTAPQGAPRGPRAGAAAGAEDTFTVSHGDIPASPPPEVLDAIDAAGRVAQELHAQGRELRFAVPSHDGEDGERVRIELRDLDGNVLREIPPSEALDVASGTSLS
jgi:hypothetical protein